MAKGFFTQATCFLTDGAVAIADVRAALQAGGFTTTPRQRGEHWATAGESLLLPFQREARGHVTVDVVNQAWPDAMGDPKSEPNTFAAWSMGHFGPLTYPGALERARQHAWSWPAGREQAAAQRGFIRLRLSYAFGAAANDPVFPDAYDPVAELMFLGRLTLALFKLRGVICYFNPGGEVLGDEASFRATWEPCLAQALLPLALWSNVRFFQIGSGFVLMDTVGNGQLDLPDLEAVFPIAQYQPTDVSYYLRNVTQYLLDSRAEFQTGEAIDGPGESDLGWTIEVLDEALVAPPRRALRVFPRAQAPAVAKALVAARRA